MESRKWNKPRKWNTFAADRVVFRLRGFTVRCLVKNKYKCPKLLSLIFYRFPQNADFICSYEKQTSGKKYLKITHLFQKFVPSKISIPFLHSCSIFWNTSIWAVIQNIIQYIFHPLVCTTLYSSPRTSKSL